MQTGQRGAAVASAPGCIWLPITDVDPSFDHFLCTALQRWCVSHGHGWLNITDDLPILTGIHPPWWNSIPVAQRVEMAQLFLVRPVRQAAWLVWLNALDLGFFNNGGVPLIPAGVGNYVLADFPFNPRVQDQFSEFCERWTRYVPVLQRFFFTADSISCTKEGSLAQTARQSSFQGAFILDMSHALDTNSVSLCSLFPCTANTKNSVGRHDKRDTANILLGEAHTRCVLKDLKDPP